MGTPPAFSCTVCKDDLAWVVCTTLCATCNSHSKQHPREFLSSYLVRLFHNNGTTTHLNIHPHYHNLGIWTCVRAPNWLPCLHPHLCLCLVLGDLSLSRLKCMLLGEICLVHIFRSILINSSSFFNDFSTLIYANIPLRLFSIFLMFFSILFIYIWCVFALTHPKQRC